jgi:hypothetical protein
MLLHGARSKATAPVLKAVGGARYSSDTVEAKPIVSRDRSVPEATARLHTGMIARA